MTSVQISILILCLTVLLTVDAFGHVRRRYEDQLLDLIPKESTTELKSQAEVMFPLHFGPSDYETGSYYVKSNVLKRIKRKGGFSRGKGSKGRGGNKPRHQPKPTQFPPNSYPKQPSAAPVPANGYPKQPGAGSYPGQPGYPAQNPAKPAVNQPGYGYPGYGQPAGSPGAGGYPGGAQPPKPGWNPPGGGGGYAQPGVGQPNYGGNYGKPSGGYGTGLGTGLAGGAGAGLLGAGMGKSKIPGFGKISKGGTGMALGAGLLGAGVGLYAGHKLAKGMMYLGGYHRPHGYQYYGGDHHDHYHDVHGHYLGPDGVYHYHDGGFAHDARMHLNPNDPLDPSIASQVTADINGTRVNGEMVRYYPYNETHGLFEYSKESRAMAALKQNSPYVRDYGGGCPPNVQQPFLTTLLTVVVILLTVG